MGRPKESVTVTHTRAGSRILVVWVCGLEEPPVVLHAGQPIPKTRRGGVTLQWKVLK